MARGRVVQRADTEETRRAILRAAHDLFMELGYRAVTTRMVADASGVKQPLLYYHFADKEALYLEVQREQSMAYKVALERIAARLNESIPERLQSVVLYLRRSRQQNMGMLMHELKYELSPVARIVMKELFLTCIVTPIMSIFEDGLRTGFLRSPIAGGVPARVATYLLLSAVSGLSEKPDAPDEVEVETSLFQKEGFNPAQMLVQVLLYGMATGQPPAIDADV
ncbi:MAG: TetR/AcrR family transcriptional regulator [Ktedonobacteraceae bacterium]|nr:TetR/AcrR family transcriptional regulator [Ktedonobacteraceae bacterium]